MLDTLDNNGNPGEIYTAKDSIWLCTLRLTLNLLSHILISIVVIICLWFSYRSTKFCIVELHIMLCVLGYQFFMNHGILALSKYNSWTKFIKQRHRKSLHWFLELVGAMLVIIGSIEIIDFKKIHFNTLHGILGLCALISTMISILNGLATSVAAKFSGHGINPTLVAKCVHGLTGVGTLFLSAGSLHYGYDKGSFKKWIDSEHFILILKVFTWMFTLLVGFEFWIILGKRIKYQNVNGNVNTELSVK